METLLQDVRYALRMLRKSPGFTVVAVVTLALGIGANTAVFSVVRAVLLKSLPYRQPDRLMVLDEFQQQNGRASVAWPNFLDWRTQSHSFEAMAAYREDDRTLTGVGEPTLLRAGEVSAPFFSLLGAQPMLGRTFGEADDKPEASPAVVLDYGFWRNRLGGDSSVVGHPITLGGVPFTVVGVLSPGFKFFQQPIDVYLPLGLEGAKRDWLVRGNHPGLRVLARLNADVSQAAAQAEMDVLMRGLEKQYPQSNSGERVQVTSLYEQRFADWTLTFYTLLAAVACVLLIACANVANLLMARATARHREFAVRLAIGAGRRQILRQLLTESVLLSSMGGVLGLLLAPWVIAPLLKMAPQGVPRLAETRVDGVVMLFTFAVAVLTGIVFGSAPAWQSSRTPVGDCLKERTGGSGRPRQRLRAGLFVSEVALALVLVVACGLLIRSLERAQSVNPGFKADHILAFDVLLPSQQYSDEKSIARFFTESLQQVRSLPGVVSAGAVHCPPLVGMCWGSVYVVADEPVPPQSELPTSAFNMADPEYFRTMQVPLLEGRYFGETDTGSSGKVVIINKKMADLWWPHQSALGKRIKQGFPQDNTPYREVVGVVGDLKQEGLDAEQLPEVFEPASQNPGEAMTVVARTDSDPMLLAKAVEGAIHSVDANLPLSAVQPMTQYVSESLARRRFSTLLLTLFGGLALMLASLGIYGVMAYTVAQRTHEIGVRMALGADRRKVLGMVLSQGLRLGLLGVGIGLGLAAIATHWMASLLFGVSDKDPGTFAAVAGLLTVVALLACYIPARRATNVDPMVALRYE